MAALPERLLLVGFMGAGKSSVGRVVADRLGWRFVDFDAEIERTEGRSIPAIFEQDGEERFREVESAVATRLLGQREVVLSAGGGWAADPARFEELPAGTATVWLKVSPETAVDRCSTHRTTRPLLDVDDPVGAARELLRSRSDGYAAAGWAVDTEGRTVEDVSARILDWVHRGPPDAGFTNWDE